MSYSLITINNNRLTTSILHACPSSRSQPSLFSLSIHSPSIPSQTPLNIHHQLAALDTRSHDHTPLIVSNLPVISKKSKIYIKTSNLHCSSHRAIHNPTSPQSTDTAAANIPKQLHNENRHPAHQQTPRSISNPTIQIRNQKTPPTKKPTSLQHT